MTEKDYFIEMWGREKKTLMNLLEAFPPDKGDFKPAEKTPSAKELAWKFVSEQNVAIEGAATGKIQFDKLPKAPATFKEVLAALNANHGKVVDAVKKMSDADWESQMDFFVGPGQMGKIRRADLLWFMMYDLIHHRGQFSIYNRLVGAKVPSIYGPSADEPWM